MDKKYTAPNGKSRSSSQYIFSEACDWLETFCLALSLMIVLFLFVFKYVTVDGRSMNDTLQDEDKLIITSIGGNYEYGDIVVIRDYAHTEPLIKRVIATEGQTVTIDFENWTVTVDGTVLDEPYIKRQLSAMHGYMYYTGPITVEEGKVFVMGDNRNDSMDSRDPRVGQLSVHDILGKVVLRVFPFSAFGTVD